MPSALFAHIGLAVGGAVMLLAADGTASLARPALAGALIAVGVTGLLLLAWAALERLHPVERFHRWRQRRVIRQVMVALAKDPYFGREHARPREGS